MMVMPANSAHAKVHFWAGRYPGKIGWLVGPSAMSKTKFREWLPFALDNDAFSAWTSGKPWDEQAWRGMLKTIAQSGLSPLWVLVPDVVANKEATLEKWDKFHSVVEAYGWPPAIAVQDGMTPADVPQTAQMVFVGGNTEWKWRSLPTWTAAFPGRVHVGRVNALERLHICERHGVRSVDGTGWMQATADGRQGRGLEAWLEGHPPHPELNLSYA